MAAPKETWGFSSPMTGNSVPTQSTRRQPQTPTAISNHYGGNRDDDMEFNGNWNDDDGDQDDWSDDDEVPRRQRSRSYGDAEEILYYESFSIDNSANGNDSYNHTSNNGLHQRTHTNTSGIHQRNLPYQMRQSTAPQTPRQPNYGYEFYKTPTPKRKTAHGGYVGSNAYMQNGNGSVRGLVSFWRRRTLLKCCLAIGFFSYVILLIKSSLWLLDRAGAGINKSEADIHHYQPPHWRKRQAFASPDDYSLNHMEGHQTSIQDLIAPQFKDSNAWSQERLLMDQKARGQSTDRNTRRKQRTRPRPLVLKASVSTDNKWYSSKHLADTSDATFGQPIRDQRLQAASIDQLCGVPAQQGSRLQPDHYPPENALNGRGARVLITGILNPLGFNLAMYLHNQCGVEIIGGIDSMFPNTVQNRLQLHDRLQILHTNIPKLVKPLPIPYIGLQPRADKDKKSNILTDMAGANSSPENFDLLAMKPTHVIHLGSYTDDIYSDAVVDPTWRNSYSPYVDMETNQRNPMYQFRSSMASMEEVVASIHSLPPERRPHLVYASVPPEESQNAKGHSSVHRATKQIDEVLAETYKIPSIAIRLPNAIFGPWGQAGSTVHDLMETTVSMWNASTTDSSLVSTTSESESPRELQLMHVDDAVEAIVAALQFRTTAPIAVDLSTENSLSTSSIAAILESFLPHRQSSQTGIENLIQQTQQQSLPQNNLDSQVPIGQWKQETSIHEGFIKTLAWHLNKDSPYGPQLETADDFLTRQGHSTCEANDWQCHKGNQYLPCISECSTRQQCTPSIFDEIKDLTVNVTEGCDIVMYTQSLGYNVKDLELHAEYMDDIDLKDDEKLVCNFAFVPRESDLVSIVTSKVPNEQLIKFGIDPKASKNSKEVKRAKLDGLNGRLLYRGWILLWMRDATQPLSVTDQSLLKLSPSKLFAPDVSHALFVEENFAVSPNLEDVMFLVSEMKRRALPERTLKKDVTSRTPLGHEISARKRFRLPAEPKRRAAILFAPLRFPSGAHKEISQRFNYGNKKITVLAASKFMRYEWDSRDTDREPADIRRQREFYERIPSYMNRALELRSPMEPWYRYSLSHWVRSRWVVHDVKLEDSRLLRCDWYQEHVEWGTKLDQLTFAHVMAMRELKRRIAHMEADDHVKAFIDQHPDLKDLTDSYEWHPMETEHNRLYREPVKWTSHVPDHITVDRDLDEELAVEESAHEPAPLYVRIMSERVMGASRKIWTKKKQQMAKLKK